MVCLPHLTSRAPQRSPSAEPT